MVTRKQFGTTFTRRAFAQGLTAGATIPAIYAHGAQSEWGGPVVDCHHHMGRTPEANIAHLDGSGMSNAMVLARENSGDQMKALEAQYPGRFLGWFASADITKPEA
jgi:hypothetical protein